MAYAFGCGDSLQYENILNLDLEMPERTTHDYDGMMLPPDAQYAEVRPQPTSCSQPPVAHCTVASHRIAFRCIAWHRHRACASACRTSFLQCAVHCRARARVLACSSLRVCAYADSLLAVQAAMQGGYAYDEEDIAAMMAACELRLRIAFMLLLPSSSTLSVLALCAPFVRVSPIRLL